MNSDGNTEKWEFGGDSWTVSGFAQVGAGKLTELDSKLNLKFNFSSGKGYLNSNGEITVTEAQFYKATPIYLCKKGDIFKYKGYGLNSGKSYVFFFNGKAVSSGTIQSNSNYVDIEIPDGVNGVRFGSYSGSSIDVILDVKSDNFLPTTQNEDGESVNDPISQAFFTQKTNDIIKDLEYFNNYIEISQVDGYMNINGTITSGSQKSGITNIIPVRKGDTFHYVGVRESASRCWVAFDDDGKVIERDSESTYFTQIEFDVEVKENWSYLRFSAINNYSTNLKFEVTRTSSSGKTPSDLILSILSEIDEIKNKEVDINKKRKISRGIHFCGHSIWANDGATYTQYSPFKLEGYQTRILNEFSFNSIQDISMSGHTIKTLYEDGASKLTGAFGDIYLIDTNTNDAWAFSDEQIGTIDDYDNNTGLDTYYGALRMWVDKINSLTDNNNIIVFSNMCKTQAQISGKDNASYTDKLHKIFNATLEIANKINAYYVDQNNLVPITDYNYELCFFDKTTHLNNYGYQIAVEPWLDVLNQIYCKDID